MTAVVATYKDAKTIWNVQDDLISTGIPKDTIKIDKEHMKIRVMVPDQTKAEIMEILNRHAPAEIHLAPEPPGVAKPARLRTTAAPDAGAATWPGATPGGGRHARIVRAPGLVCVSDPGVERLRYHCERFRFIYGI